MAIVNVTPDSFYADSRTPQQSQVRSRVEQVIGQGASIVDIGGYSSRPGAADVSVEEEWQRVRLGVEELRRVSAKMPFSVDTFRAEIVSRVYDEFGEFIVNDISGGLMDKKMIRTVAKLKIPFVAMHMRGTPQTMQQMTDYGEVTEAVVQELAERVEEMLDCGMREENMLLDPGFGFSKTTEQNYELMRNLSEVCRMGYPVLVGVSRKSMIYKLLGITPQESLFGTSALNWEALRQGATILRVHDVSEAVGIVKMFKLYAR